MSFPVRISLETSSNNLAVKMGIKVKVKELNLEIRLKIKVPSIR